MRMGSIDHSQPVNSVRSEVADPSDGPPPSWACIVERFADGVCDCECGAYDPDCDMPSSKVELASSLECLPASNFSF